MFKPFHDITTQAVALTPIFYLSWLNYNRIECFLSQVDADGNVLEGLYDKNGAKIPRDNTVPNPHQRFVSGVLQTDKAFVLTRT